MFCQKCGAQLSENAKFCQKCGAQQMAGAAAQRQTEVSAAQAAAQPGEAPIAAPGKKRKKWPMILGAAGGILCLLIILAAIGGNDDSGNPPKQNSAGVELSETLPEYTSEAGSDLVQEDRVYIGETQTVDCGWGKFEVTLDYVELADRFVEDMVTPLEMSPKQGYVFLCTGITAKNIDKTDGSLSNPKLIFDGEYEFDIRYRSGSWLSSVPPLSPPETAVFAFELPISVIESSGSLAIQFDVSDFGGSDENGNDFFVIRQGENDAVSVPVSEEWQAAEGTYTDYLAWCGEYDGGWLDTYLKFELYTDGTQNPECGYLTAIFRGNETSGKLYYLGDNEFQWDEEQYGEVKTYYIFAIEADGAYQLELNSLGEDTVIFTQYQQYVS